MAELNYTKGEWYLNDLHGHFDLRCDCGDGRNIDIAHIWKGIHTHGGIANAHLIASAPNLYEACKGALNMLDAIDHIYPTPKTQQELKEALAKAEGKQ